MTILAFKGKKPKKPNIQEAAKKTRRILKTRQHPPKYNLESKHNREREFIRAALQGASGSIKIAAQISGEKYNTFWRKCQRLGLLDFAKQLRKGEKQ